MYLSTPVNRFRDTWINPFFKMAADAYRLESGELEATLTRKSIASVAPYFKSPIFLPVDKFWGGLLFMKLHFINARTSLPFFLWKALVLHDANECLSLNNNQIVVVMKIVVNFSQRLYQAKIISGAFSLTLGELPNQPYCSSKLYD